MTEPTITTAHRAARNAASAALADAGAQASSIALYAAPGGLLLARRTLQKPCAAITPEGRLQLLQDGAGADLVLASGSAAWAAWLDGAGQPIAEGPVSDAAGAGWVRLQGTAGTQLYAGGAVLLADPALLG